VATAEELRTRLTEMPYDRKTNGGVVLTADIEAAGNVFSVGAAPGEVQPAVPFDKYMISGGGFTISGGGSGSSEGEGELLAIYANDVRIIDLVVERAVADGIYVRGVEMIDIENVTIRDCGGYGLVVDGASVYTAWFTSGGNGDGGVRVIDSGGGPAIIPTYTLAHGVIADRPAIVTEVEENDINLPGGWTFDGEECDECEDGHGGIGVWSPPTK
jgi:hypothetical protein